MQRPISGFCWKGGSAFLVSIRHQFPEVEQLWFLVLVPSGPPPADADCWYQLPSPSRLPAEWRTFGSDPLWVLSGYLPVKDSTSCFSCCSSRLLQSFLCSAFTRKHSGFMGSRRSGGSGLCRVGAEAPCWLKRGGAAGIFGFLHRYCLRRSDGRK